MFTDVSEVLTAFINIALMMVAARTSETSVNVYQTTRRNNPEDSHLKIMAKLIKYCKPIFILHFVLVLYHRNYYSLQFLELIIPLI
jgi:hypothetical protein